MSNFLAVATVTAALQRMLQGSAGIDVPEVRVSTERPDTGQNGAAGPSVNIFLYQVTPNAALRNADLPTRGPGGQLMQRPQAALDLYYLLSFSGDDAQLEPQRLLGSTVRTLHAHPVLTPDVIKAVVDAASTTPPIHPALRDSDLADQVELVKLVPLSLNLDELSDLWSMFVQAPYALSVAYQASVVLIEDVVTPSPVLPVVESDLVVTTLRRPRIERVVSQAGADRPIFATDTLAIQGSQLGGENTLVRVAGADRAPAGVSDNVVTLALSEVPTGALRAGSVPVRIVQQMSMGRPPTPRSLVESNQASFVLHPTVTDVRATDAPDRTVTVATDVDVGPDQRVILVLLDPSTAERRHLFDAPAGNAGSNTVDVPLTGVETGRYLVQVQVDGAASQLDRNAAGDLTGPAVTLA